MPLIFFLDEPQARKDLTEFAKRSSPAAHLLDEDGCTTWNGNLPRRVGDYFYGSRWLLYSGQEGVRPEVDLWVFTADSIKTLRQVDETLAIVSKSTEWAIFPWGGYSDYGMLGLYFSDIFSPAALAVKGREIFRYPSVQHFSEFYRGLIGRRGNQPEFTLPLWRALRGEEVHPLVVTFEYREDEDFLPFSFSVEGTIRDTDGSALSIYRIHDSRTFEYFVDTFNRADPFHLLPGILTVESCGKVQQMLNALDLKAALVHTPWFLVFNGGEIDTNHLLFGASDNSVLAHFVAEMNGPLKFPSYF